MSRRRPKPDDARVYAQRLNARDRRILLALPDTSRLPFQDLARAALGAPFVRLVRVPHAWAVGLEPWPLSEMGERVQHELRLLEETTPA